MAGKNEMVDLVAAINAAHAENKATQKSYTRHFLVVIVFLLAAIALLTWAAFFHFPQAVFIPTQNAAAMCQVAPLNTPRIDQAEVEDFAERAVVSIYTYNYLTYRQNVMDAADKFFTPAFHDGFINLFSSSQTLQTVIDKRFIVTATGTANSPPVIRRAGLRKGAYAWDVEVPVTVYYTSGHEQHEDRMIATVTVTQDEPNVRNPRGIGVDNIDLRQALN